MGNYIGAAAYRQAPETLGPGCKEGSHRLGGWLALVIDGGCMPAKRTTAAVPGGLEGNGVTANAWSRSARVWRRMRGRAELRDPADPCPAQVLPLLYRRFPTDIPHPPGAPADAPIQTQLQRCLPGRRRSLKTSSSGTLLTQAKQKVPYWNHENTCSGRKLHLAAVSAHGRNMSAEPCVQVMENACSNAHAEGVLLSSDWGGRFIRSHVYFLLSVSGVIAIRFLLAAPVIHKSRH